MSQENIKLNFHCICSNKKIYVDKHYHDCDSFEKECEYLNNDKVVGIIGHIK